MTVGEVASSVGDEIESVASEETASTPIPSVTPPADESVDPTTMEGTDMGLTTAEVLNGGVATPAVLPITVPATATTTAVMDSTAVMTVGTTSGCNTTPVLEASSPNVAGGDPSSLVETMTQLLKAHTEAIAAQTQATAAHNLPPLKPYTGEGKQVEEEGFDRWLEQFEERGRVAGWTPTQQLHQLKLLLEKTALRVFRMLPDDDRGSYEKVTEALHNRFKPMDIEELFGLDFHHRMQSDETIEELGLELQALGRKAFPSIVGREFDRLLKGRFFQALHVKWQWKPSAPEVGELFKELYSCVYTTPLIQIDPDQYPDTNPLRV